MGELMGVGGAGIDYLKSCNKHIFVPKLSASWDAFFSVGFIKFSNIC